MNHTLTQLPVQNRQVSSRSLPKPEKHIVKKTTDRYKYLVGVLHLLLLNLSLLASLTMMNTPEMVFDPANRGNLWMLGGAVNAVWLMVVPSTKLYRSFDGIKLDLKIRDLFQATIIYFGVFSLLYQLEFISTIKAIFLVPACLIFLTLSTIAHYVIRYYNRNAAPALSYVVVGGGTNNLRYLNKVLTAVYGKNIHCVGRFAQDEIQGVPALGTYDEIENYLQRNSNISKLLYFYSDLSKSEVQRVIQLCRNQFIDFEIIPIGVDFFERGIQVEQLAHLPIFRRKTEPLCRMRNKILKRAFDIVFSSMVLLMFSIFVFPFVALAIWLESKGPIFFRQERTGYWNKPFQCLKFRTMHVNNDSDRQQATTGDNRITKVGAFLRKTNLDELPQFWNVLMGDMSVVGPRPHMLKHTEDYSKLIDKYMIRHEVKPGITGWAQVTGWRGPTEELYQMAKRVEQDVNYIENWSIWFDCKCIFLTVFNMVKGDANAF